MSCKRRYTILAVSPDGKTLAGGDSNGIIKLFDFETLQPLYRINQSTDGIAALAFTSDSLRLIDRRGAQVNVWEPSALVRKWDYVDDKRSEFSSEASAPPIQGSGMSPIEEIGDITEMKTAYTGSLAICGRNNGSIDVCDLNSTEPAFQELYKHKTTFMSIISLDWNEVHQIVASADVSSRFKVLRLFKGTDNTIAVHDELLDAQLPYGQPVSQLLISPDGTKVLVSSPTADYVWSLQTGKLVASRKTDSRTNWKWFTHPQQSIQFVLLENSTLYYFSWKTAGSFSEAAEFPIDIGERQSLDLETMNLETNSKTLVIKVSTAQENPGDSLQLRNAKKRCLYTLDLSTPDSLGPLLLKPFFASQGNKEPHSANIILGTAPSAFDSRLLVFIADSGWICTVDLEKAAPHTSSQRHFFLPSAWLSTGTKIISAVTERKDILFVRGNEVAVIKRGLEAGEVISMCES